MVLLLLLHVPQHRAARAATQHRELAGIDAGRAIFARVIDPDRALDAGVWVGVARKRRGLAHAALRPLRQR